MVAFHEMSEAAFEMPSAEAFQLSPGVIFCQKGKTAFDILLTLASLPLAIPAMIVIAAAVKWDSKGDIFFSQKRLGKGGKPFKIYKFRTMYPEKCDKFGGAQATSGDKRVTPVGRWLRRSSLDELPQLWNVLRGEMSLIGPRPHAVAHDMYFSNHIENYWRRYAVKPGLTGWAQINGSRGETKTIEDMAARVEYDLDYIAKRTWIMDIKIALKTFKVMFFPPRCLH